MEIRPLHRPAAANAGFSLASMIVTVAIVGIMSAIAVVAYKGVLERSSETVAQNTVQHLNQAVTSYLQLEGVKLLSVPADDTSSAEEIDVLRALQWNDPAFPSPGAPYMRSDFDPAGSSDTTDYRAVWNGAYFELRIPGVAGAGLEIALDATDLGRPVNFPPGFSPLSSY